MKSPRVAGPEERALALYLRTLPAVRERCTRLLRLAEADALPHFRYRPERLPAAVARVAATTREQYPGLCVPLHSRWRHFSVGGIDRVARLEAAWGACDAPERARRKIDLAVVSVLLDAGAGPGWHYAEQGTGRTWSRSEGLALASLDAFAAGLFASRRGDPWRADAAALRSLEPERLAGAFQVSADNPLAGLSGRAALLRRLGEALAARPELFGREAPRPGGIVDGLRAQSTAGVLPIAVLWAALMEGLSPIWPEDRPHLAGLPLGDAWPHSALAGPYVGDALVPFHKLTQWLAYSLLEPLTEAGLRVAGTHELTGLAEYRNGGLLFDVGVLEPRDAGLAARPLAQGSEPVVEWRALTVAVLDRLAGRLRDSLGLSADALPLGAVLQGGTWEAGRRLARERRPGGAPPFQIESDGMLF